MQQNSNINLLDKAEQLQQQAQQIMDDLGIVTAWHKVGATVNLVGSAAMGLMINKRDIDLHVYTNPFDLADSFKAMAHLAQQPGLQSINYANLVNMTDRCLEWHATYIDKDQNSWTFDIIHLLPDSQYAGHFEEVAKRITAALTPQTKLAILTIKNQLPKDSGIMGIQVYQAVLQGGVRDYPQFRQWLQQNPVDGIIEWMPK